MQAHALCQTTHSLPHAQTRRDGERVRKHQAIQRLKKTMAHFRNVDSRYGVERGSVVALIGDFPDLTSRLRVLKVHICNTNYMEVFINVYKILMSELFDIGKKQYRVYKLPKCLYSIHSKIYNTRLLGTISHHSNEINTHTNRINLVPRRKGVYQSSKNI